MKSAEFLCKISHNVVSIGSYSRYLNLNTRCCDCLRGRESSTRGWSRRRKYAILWWLKLPQLMYFLGVLILFAQMIETSPMSDGNVAAWTWLTFGLARGHVIVTTFLYEIQTPANTRFSIGLEFRIVNWSIFRFGVVQRRSPILRSRSELFGWNVK